ncbi:DPH2 [Candida jiufengensis]|uniref:DPH2 n=1 Tax=Candida jiufengensis TaxID=497108 RepID=UPI002225ADEF|nr:DPH2 [Candida jiufengensis]KAI5955228.1 DPH2 [Candida jiufengensis]
MPSGDVAIAPSLSTHQDDSTFTYDKVQTKKKERQHLKLKNRDDYQELINKIRSYYSLDELIADLGDSDYDKVTLQFPDELICDSATMVQLLQQELPDKKFWILADTSYSSCCVDEVAAEHVQSDLVVHFGDACLNEVAKINAKYVLGKPEVDLDEILSQFKQKFSKDDKIVLMADAPHTHILNKLKKSLREYKDIVIAELISTANTNIIGYNPTIEYSHTQFNRAFPIHNFSNYHLFHITKPEAPRLLQLSTNFASVTTYDPTTNKLSQGPFPNLMRRYKFVHMVRSSGTIGILVNTLSLSNTKQLINTIKHKITQAGKKVHILVVGKPNVAKLANFDSIDLWCVLGCDHKGIIIDQTNEFYKPIVTPYELLLGLSDELTWTGRWITDYKSVIQEYKNEEEEENADRNSNDNDNNSSDEEPEFDPVTGKYVSNSKPLRQINHLSIKNTSEDTPNENALVERFSNKVAIRNTVSTSAMHLQNRQWTGLGSDYKNNGDSDDDSDEDEGAVVEEGRGGIARGYDYDTQAK